MYWRNIYWHEFDNRECFLIGGGYLNEWRFEIVRVVEWDFGGITTEAHISCRRLVVLLRLASPFDLKYCIALLRLLILLAGLV